MVLKLVLCDPAEAHADALRDALIQRDAYRDDRFTSVLFPGPVKEPEATEARAQQMVTQLQTDSTMCWLKVIDTELPESEQTVACAQWHVNVPAAAPPTPPVWMGGANVEACDAVFGRMHKFRQSVLGDQPHLYLKYLTTDPKHQRRGAGRMLMQWGIAEADRLGVPIWLESSLAGHRLYLSCGFRDAEELRTDMSRFGGSGTHVVYSMRREPATVENKS